MRISTRRFLWIVVALLIACQFFWPCAAFATDDMTPPVITDFGFVQQGQTVRPGDTVTFRAKITDESGIETAYLMISRENGPSTVDLWLNFNSVSGFYEASFSVPEMAVNGKHIIVWMYAEDLAGNMREFEEIPNCFFYVHSGTDDLTPPAITDMGFDKQGQVVRPGDTVTFRAKITDESGIETSYLMISRENGPSTVDLWLNFNSVSGFYEASFIVPEMAVNGKHIIVWMYAEDLAGNTRELETISTCFFYVTEATRVWVDGDLGTPGDREITGLQPGKKYLLVTQSDRPYSDIFCVNADGTAGTIYGYSTKYESLQPLTGTRITGLKNGRHYQVIECHGEGGGGAYFPDSPDNLRFTVFSISPADDLYAQMAGVTSGAGELLDILDIVANGTLPPEGILISFSVGWQYAGHQVTIFHLNSATGQTDTHHTTVDENGMATIRVYSLSPFAIVLGSPPAPPPQTGDGTPLLLWSLLLCISAACLCRGIALRHRKLRLSK